MCSYLHRYRLLAVLAALIAGLTGCTGGAISPSPFPSPPIYTGLATCVTCHAEASNKWLGSHHDLAMQPAADTTVLGDFNGATFTYAGITSTFYRQDNAFFVSTEGPDGTLQTYEIAYTFGVTPLQQYLIAFPDGRYQALSIAWDSRPAEDGGQRWFHLYPDEQITHEDPLHWTGLYQNWNFMCASCHSTDLEKNYSFEDDRYATTWSDIDVACEACHGPGSNHILWAEERRDSTRSFDASEMGLTVTFPAPFGVAWTMNPETGTVERTSSRLPDTQIETCAPCHSRRSAIADAHTPGDPFLRTYRPALLEEGLYYPDGQIQDEVYVYGSFLQSKMYRAGVTCSDCHDPHSLTLRAPGNALCARCHLPTRYDTPDHHFHEPDTPGAQCVECHMPSRTYMVVDPRRDHSMRIPRPHLSLTTNAPNACNQCHADKTTSWAAEAAETWYGPAQEDASHYGAVLYAGRTGAPDAHVSLTRLAADTTQPAIVRASAVALLERYAGPRVGAALQTALQDEEPLVRYAAAHALDAFAPEARLPLAYPLLSDTSRLVRIEAARVLSPLPAHVFTPEQGTLLDETIAEYIDAEMVNADRPETHLNLGLLYTARAQYEEAESAYRTALRLSPYSVEARINLADLYRLLEDDASGERILREALELTPDVAEVHHALGLLLIRLGRRTEGVEALGEAAALQPQNPRFSYVYGVALHSEGHTDRALATLEAAHQRHPTHRDLLIALATMHRDNGSIATARKYARDLLALAPDDPMAQRLLAQLNATE